MVVSRQFNYNISVRGYSIYNSKKASKIKACGVTQTPKYYYIRGGTLDMLNAIIIDDEKPASLNIQIKLLSN